MALKSFADVQNFINTILTQNKEGGAVVGPPHGAFWSNLTYQQFTTGNVPGRNSTSSYFSRRQFSAIQYHSSFEGGRSAL